MFDLQHLTTGGAQGRQQDGGTTHAASSPFQWRLQTGLVCKKPITLPRHSLKHNVYETMCGMQAIGHVIHSWRALVVAAAAFAGR